jgi:hypothetical protein
VAISNRFQPPAAGADPQESLGKISAVVDQLALLAQYKPSQEAVVSAVAGDFKRLAPRATGQNVVIPTADGSNFGKMITLFVDNGRGPLRVRPVAGTINGSTALNYDIGSYTIVLYSNGQGRWATGADLNALPVIPANTFLGNTTGAAAQPTANSLNTLAGAGLAYASGVLNYVGSTSVLTLTGITGNQGTVDVSTLRAGGTLFISAPTGDWSIEGFSGNNTQGFWFRLFVGSGAFVGTLFDEDATPTAVNRLRVIGGVDLIATRMQAYVHYNAAGTRWGVVGAATDGRLLSRTVLTTGTAATFNHHAACRFFVIKGVGGGAAGGGPTAVAQSLGSCGGSGTYGERLITRAATTSTYTVGAAGAGVSGAAGGNGTASTWTHNAVVTTLPGGTGGATSAAAAPLVLGGGIGGGNATNADLNSPGCSGGDAVKNTAPLISFHLKGGGESVLGRGGVPRATVAGAAAGGSGTDYGAGGSGALNGTTAAAQLGAPGSAGVWIVEEYS